MIINLGLLMFFILVLGYIAIFYLLRCIILLYIDVQSS